MPNNGVPRRATRATYRDDYDRECTRCRAVISAGAPHVRDVTKAPQHPDCARRRVTPHVEREAPRSWSSPIPRPSATDVVVECPGCGQTITAEQWSTSVTAFGLRWHGDCRRRAQGGAAR